MLVTKLLFIKKSLTSRKPVIRTVTSFFIKKSAPIILKSDLIIDGDVAQSLSQVQHFVTPWTAACQASLYFTISLSLLKLRSIESVIPSNHLILCCHFSSCSLSFPASGSFPMSQFFASGGQSIGASASVLPMNIQG